MNKSISGSSSLAKAVVCYVKSCGINSVNLHQKIFGQVEPLLLETVMEQSQYKKNRAINVLGISRNNFYGLLSRYFDKRYSKINK